MSFQGNMVISVSHGGDPIPKSPFHITVAPALDIGKVKVEGLDTSKLQTLHTMLLHLHHVKVVNCKVLSVSCQSFLQKLRLERIRSSQLTQRALVGRAMWVCR